MAIADFKVAGENGNWRVEGRFADGRTFYLQPTGQINFDEAQSLCEAIVYALRSAPVPDNIETIGASIRMAARRG